MQNVAFPSGHEDRARGIMRVSKMGGGGGGLILVEKPDGRWPLERLRARIHVQVCLQFGLPGRTETV
jgi:hypothetical protein